MTTRHTTIPTLDQYVSDLLQLRRSDYLAELETLRKQLWHKNWLAECSQIVTEINDLTGLPLMTLVPSLDSFSALAKVRSRYNRDVTRIISASGMKANEAAKQKPDHREAIGHALNRLVMRVFGFLGTLTQRTYALAGKSAQTHAPTFIRMN